MQDARSVLFSNVRPMCLNCSVIELLCATHREWRNLRQYKNRFYLHFY